MEDNNSLNQKNFIDIKFNKSVYEMNDPIEGEIELHINHDQEKFDLFSFKLTGKKIFKKKKKQIKT